MSTKKMLVPTFKKKKMKKCKKSQYELSPNEKLSVMKALDHLFLSKKYTKQCAYCKKISWNSEKCSHCDYIYCDLKCRQLDWADHKRICYKFSESFENIRSVPKKMNTKSITKTSSSRPDNSLEVKEKALSSNNTLFCAVVPNKVNALSSSSENNNVKRQSDDHEGKTEKKNTSETETVNSIPSSFEEESKDLSECSNPLQKKVYCMQVESNNKLWLMYLDDLKKLCHIQKNLHYHCNEYETIEAEENLVCACYTDEKWFRGKVLSISPNSIQVLLIDFGQYHGLPSTTTLRKLPEEIENIPGLACLVEYEKQTPTDNIKEEHLFPKKIIIEEIKKTIDEVSCIRVIKLDLEQPHTSLHDLVKDEFENRDLISIICRPNTSNSTFFIRPRENTLMISNSTEVNEEKSNSDSAILESEIELNDQNSNSDSNILETENSVTDNPTTETSQSVKDDEKKQLNLMSEKPEKDLELRRSLAINQLTDSAKGVITIRSRNGSICKGSLIIGYHFEARYAAITILEYSLQGKQSFAAKRNEYVLVGYNGEEYRGKVLIKLIDTYYVHLIDCGLVISTNKVFELPPEDKYLMGLAIKITVEDVIEPDLFENLESFDFHVIKEKDTKKFLCALKGNKDELIAKVIVEKMPQPPEFEPESMILESGSLVIISSLNSSRGLFIRPLGDLIDKKSTLIHEELTELAKENEKLSSPPQVGDLFNTKFYYDDCYYRGLVISVEGDKVNILFVDFGNTQVTDVKDLKPLPFYLKVIPYFSVNVKLLNVPELNSDMITYLKNVIRQQISLTLTYENSINDGIILTDHMKGVVINTEVNKLNSISNENIDCIPDVIFETALEATIISPGTKYKLVVLNVEPVEFASDFVFWSTEMNPNFLYVNQQLSVNINNYCIHISKPYLPQKNETCLVESDGDWYRASVLEIFDDGFHVFLLDFGKSLFVSSECIRGMQDEFAVAPILNMRCRFTGYEKLIGNDDLKQKMFEYLLENINTQFDAEMIEDKGDFCLVRIPEIEKMLSE